MRGDARLISSTSTTLAKIGPARKSHAPVAGPYTDVPVTSAGSRSGVHCTRPNRPPIAAASDLASSVLPVPGTPSTQEMTARQQRDERQAERRRERRASTSRPA